MSDGVAPERTAETERADVLAHLRQLHDGAAGKVRRSAGLDDNASYRLRLIESLAEYLGQGLHEGAAAAEEQQNSKGE